MKRLIFFLTALLFLASCERTKLLWEDVYEEQYKQFLVSADGHVVFLSDKYHDIFIDNSGAIRELLNLNRDHAVTIDEEKSELDLEGKEISGIITFKTFDLNLPQDQLNELKFLGFQYDEKERDLTLEIALKGQRYLAGKDGNQYASLLNELYTIKVRRHLASTAKKIALTPITLTVDAVMTIGEILITPLD